MFGMDFISFLILLVISVVVSAILHFGFKYHVTPGLWSFCSKIVVGWIGAWLGTPIGGHWFANVVYEHSVFVDGALVTRHIYIIPAILGSLALLVLVIDIAKMWVGRKSDSA